MVVGITGGIGSGKSTVVNMFTKFDGVVAYIADAQAKKIMTTSNEIKIKLTSEFGSDVYINGQLNRRYLASIVFNDKKRLETLNKIVHPVVHQHFHDFVELNNDKFYILYENAILFENNSDVICDKIITVTAPQKDRVQRVVIRDNITSNQVFERINNQWDDAKKIMMSNYVIYNDDIDQTQSSVEYLHKVLLSLCFINLISSVLYLI